MKLCTLILLSYSLILSSYQGLLRIKTRRRLEQTTDLTFTTKVNQVVTWTNLKELADLQNWTYSGDTIISESKKVIRGTQLSKPIKGFTNQL